MESKDEILRLIRSADAGSWWGAAAIKCYEDDCYEAIPSRSGKSLYLLRMWLTLPRLANTKSDEEFRWDSSESILLHAFAQPDDDGAPHCHPWDFETHILQGGYREEWRQWERAEERFSDHAAYRRVGDTVQRRASDVHSVSRLCNDRPCWTLVKTGPKIRDWGFWPQPGVFVPWQKYLTEKLAVKNA